MRWRRIGRNAPPANPDSPASFLKSWMEPCLERSIGFWVAVSADHAACTVGRPHLPQPGRPCPIRLSKWHWLYPRLSHRRLPVSDERTLRVQFRQAELTSQRAALRAPGGIATFDFEFPKGRAVCKRLAGCRKSRLTGFMTIRLIVTRQFGHVTRPTASVRSSNSMGMGCVPLFRDKA
jgi:hypothetical protein